MFNQKIIRILARRIEDIGDWLSEMAPYTAADQKHLNAGSVEQAYWHHGYQAAIADVLAMAVTTSRRERNGDM
jgi:Na+/phosphate symporter